MKARKNQHLTSQSTKNATWWSVRVFVLATRFSRSAADRFVRACARPNRVDWRPLAAIISALFWLLARASGRRAIQGVDMRKPIIVILCIIASSAYCQMKIFDLPIYISLQNEDSIEYNYGGLTYHGYLKGSLNDYQQKITDKDLVLGNDGYFSCVIQNEKKIIIPGNEFIQIRSLNRDEGMMNYQDYIRNKIGKEKLENVFYFGCIKSISTNTDYYVEKIKDGIAKYDQQNMLMKIIKQSEKEEANFPWNYDALPFVVRNSNGGIGTVINIKFTKPVDSIFVLNGFVDLLRRNLYKENNRIKAIKVEYLGSLSVFDSEVSFDDSVYFQKIDFSGFVNEVNLEVMDIYKGTKYNDLAISSIITPKVTLPKRVD
jgi:hypothetical protein